MRRRTEFAKTVAGAQKVQGSAFHKGRTGFEKNLPGLRHCIHEGGRGFGEIGKSEDAGSGRAAVRDGDNKFGASAESRFQQQQKLLAFPVRFHDMHCLDAVELAEHQRDIRHWRQFQKHRAATAKNYVLQRQHVRQAVFRQKNLPSFRTPGGISENQVRPEGIQQRRQGFWRNAEPTEFHVAASKPGQICPDRFEQQGIHLVVQYAVGDEGELPAVHPQPSGEIGDSQGCWQCRLQACGGAMPGPGALYGTRPGPLLLADGIEWQAARLLRHCGLVPGGGGAAALLRTQGDGAYQLRIGIPLGHFIAQLAPGSYTFGCESCVDVGIPVPVQYQVGKVVVLMLNNEVCQIHGAKLLKMLATVQTPDRHARRRHIGFAY